MRQMFAGLLENFVQRFTYLCGELPAGLTPFVESFDEVSATTLTIVALSVPILASSVAVSTRAVAQPAIHRLDEVDFFLHICS